MNTHVEAATVDDLDRVVDMWIDLAAEQRRHGSNLRAEENREPIRMAMATHVVDGGVIVARSDAEPVGFVSFEVESSRFERSVTRGIVQNVYVEPAAREEGIGSALLDAAEGALADRGVDVIAVEAMAGNDAARRLYRRREFEPHRITFERPAGSDTHTREDG